MQNIISYWFVKTGLDNVQTLFESFAKVEEETKEVYEELNKFPVDKEALGKELGDIIFSVYLVAIQSGVDIQSAMISQLDKQFKQYNPYKVNELIESGKGQKEALKEVKNKYLTKNV
jgi:NTP pyrophosphatase (non-canonical NTP hydrolase)